MKKIRWLTMSFLALTIFCGTAFAAAPDANLDNQMQASQQVIDSGLAKLDLETLRPEEYDAVMEAAPYAYLDIDEINVTRTAESSALEDRVLDARETIIYTQDWVRDGGWAALYDKNTGELTEIPEFHDLFPEDWDLPNAKDWDIENVVNPTGDSSQGGTLSYSGPYRKTLQHPYGTIELPYPSSTTNTPAFGYYYTGNNTKGTQLYSLDCTYGLSQGQTWNAGYSGGTTADFNKTDIPYDEGLLLTLDEYTTYYFRASSYYGPLSAQIELYYLYPVYS